MASTRTDDDYIDLAEQDRHWQMVRASARIEGIVLDYRDDILSGKHTLGEITVDQWVNAIVSDYPNAVQAS